MADKEWLVKHPITGDTRTITQRDWIAGRLADKGFIKPKDLDDSGPKPTGPEPPPIQLRQQ